MNRLTPNYRGSRARSVCAFLAMIPLAVNAASAQQVTKVRENGKGGMKPKTGTLVVKQTENTRGVLLSTFNFHPRDFQVTHFVKVLGGRPRVSPASTTHRYQGGETHLTDGKVEYDLDISKNGTKYEVKADYKATINPGRSNPVKTVNIRATFLDPFTFSGSDPNSSFEYAPDGLDFSQSLGEGTAFPDVWSDGSSGGALADETAMTFRARVNSGVIADPQAFWGEDAEGAIDLYTLILSSDVDNNVSASLDFGMSSSAFQLDYRDALGNSFDPTDVGAVEAIEQLIAGSFTDGVLLSDSPDFFTVGFVPDSGVSEYTAGFGTDLNVGAVETPEPASMALLALGGLTACRRRRG